MLDLKSCHCYLHCPVKARWLELTFPLTRIHTTQASATYPRLHSRAATGTPKHHHIKITQLAKNPSAKLRLHLKVLSLSCKSLQDSQHKNLCELCTINHTSFTESSSCSVFIELQTLLISYVLQPSLYKYRVYIAAPPLWNELPPEFRAFSFHSFRLFL